VLLNRETSDMVQAMFKGKRAEDLRVTFVACANGIGVGIEERKANGVPYAAAPATPDSRMTPEAAKKELDEATARLRRRAGEIAYGDATRPHPVGDTVVVDANGVRWRPSSDGGDRFCSYDGGATWSRSARPRAGIDAPPTIADELRAVARNFHCATGQPPACFLVSPAKNKAFSDYMHAELEKQKPGSSPEFKRQQIREKIGFEACSFDGIPLMIPPSKIVPEIVAVNQATMDAIFRAATMERIGRA